MTALLGTSIPVFIGLHVILTGGAALLTGNAIASTWRPAWQVIFYGLLLAMLARFLTWSLFEGDLLSPTGYLVDAVLLCAIGLLAWRVTNARKMVGQYPWLYRRTGLTGYAAIEPTVDGSR